MRSPDESFGDAVFRDLQSDEGADPLALFESEEELNRTARPAHQRSRAEDVASFGVAVVPFAAQPPSSPARMSGSIALDLVLHRLGHVSWTEAVAIVEGLCGILNASGSLRVPEMSRIAITAEGTVAASEGGAGDDAGVLLARMLHALAAPGWLPASLRLFVTKWVSNGGQHSIAEFAKELAYFAPPDGQALIRAVYERAVATVPATEEPRPWVPRQQPTRQPSQRARVLYGSAAAVVVLGIALFSLRGAPEQRDQSPTSEPTALQEEVTEPASLALVNGSSAVPVPGGPTPPGSPAQGVPAPPRPAARSTQARAGSPSAARPRAGVRSGAPAPAPVSSAVRASLASPIAPSPRSVPVPFPSADPPSRAVRLNPAPAPRRDIELGPPVYSSSDSDVTPPAFLSPQLPSQFLSGPGPDMNTLELIVSETGTVERVRLLSTPKRMADMMLLSGAKNWEFEPAVKEGQSVRYRLQLSWAATP